MSDEIMNTCFLLNVFLSFRFVFPLMGSYEAFIVSVIFVYILVFIMIYYVMDLSLSFILPRCHYPDSISSMHSVERSHR